MEKSEYFSEISAQVHAHRTKKDYSPGEMSAYLEGKRDALREVLIACGTKQTYAAIIKRFEHALKFLKAEKEGGKLATENAETEIWEKHLQFSSQELMSFTTLQLDDYRARLKKAREVHISQSALLLNLAQMTIE